VFVQSIYSIHCGVQKLTIEMKSADATRHNICVIHLINILKASRKTNKFGLHLTAQKVKNF